MNRKFYLTTHEKFYTNNYRSQFVSISVLVYGVNSAIKNCFVLATILATTNLELIKGKTDYYLSIYKILQLFT